MRKIVFDIETKNFFSDVGSNNPKDLDISIVSIYDSESDSYKSFLQEDFPLLWQIIEKADLLIGYNSDHFDIPLLNKYYHGDLSKIKSVDLMKEIREVLGKRLKLQDVTTATLGEGKIASGIDAVVWWRQGKIDEIKKYCEADVKVTKELYDYARMNGKLKYKDGNEIKDLILDTSDWETIRETGITQSLGF